MQIPDETGRIMGRKGGADIMFAVCWQGSLLIDDFGHKQMHVGHGRVVPPLGIADR